MKGGRKHHKDLIPLSLAVERKKRKKEKKEERKKDHLYREHTEKHKVKANKMIRIN